MMCRRRRWTICRIFGENNPDPDSRDGERLELLAMLVEMYERVRFAFARPDPIEAIAFRMEQQGLRQKDIAPLLGGKNRVSEVLSRRRPLTLPMIRSLFEKLDLAPSLLIREPTAEYRVSPAARGRSAAKPTKRRTRSAK